MPCPTQDKFNYTALKEWEKRSEFYTHGTKNTNFMVANLQVYTENKGQQQSLGIFPITFTQQALNDIAAHNGLSKLIEDYNNFDYKIVSQNIIEFYFDKIIKVSQELYKEFDSLLQQTSLTADSLSKMLDKIVAILNANPEISEELQFNKLFTTLDNRFKAIQNFKGILFKDSNGIYHHGLNNNYLKDVVNTRLNLDKDTNESGILFVLKKIHKQLKDLLNITKDDIEKYHEGRSHSETFLAALIYFNLLDLEFLEKFKQQNPTAINLAIHSSKSMCNVCSYIMPYIQTLLTEKIQTILGADKTLKVSTQYSYVESTAQTKSSFSLSHHPDHYLIHQKQPLTDEFKSKFFKTMAAVTALFVNRVENPGLHDKIQENLTEMKNSNLLAKYHSERENLNERIRKAANILEKFEQPDSRAHKQYAIYQLQEYSLKQKEEISEKSIYSAYEGEL